MNYLIIADIHANKENLERVIKNHEKDDVVKICLGDIVGYGLEPNECIDLIRENDFECIAGNWDALMNELTTLNMKYYDKTTQESIEFTCKEVTSKNKAWLKQLQRTITKDNLIFVHGALGDEQDNYNGYTNTIEKANQELSKAGSNKIVFHGHTHEPSLFHNNEFMKISGCILPYLATVYDNSIISIPSLGRKVNEPKFNGYALFDSETRTLTIKEI